MGTTTKSKGQVKLFGIGKYSFLALSTPVLDFEAVLTRTSKEMEQIVTNLSPVIARFAVHRVEAWYNGHDSVYTISPMEGAIPPNSALSLKVLAFHNLHTSAFFARLSTRMLPQNRGLCCSTCSKCIGALKCG